MYILAPLAGYTDKAFREITSHFSSDGAVSEMISTEGLYRMGEKTLALAEPYEGEKNLVIQIFAPDDESIKRAGSALRSLDANAFDINAGCPVPKVVKDGSGSALMKNEKMIGKMVTALKEETGKPVSVKFRLGWDSRSINFLNFAEEAAKAGAYALTLHARTREEGYSGFAHKEAFHDMRREFEKGKGPLLFASGDVFSPEAAYSYIHEYDMDGVMIARGAIGNPFIFREVKELEEKGEYVLPALEERINVALEHLSLSIKYFSEEYAVHQMRKTMMAYIKGLDGAKAVKEKISHAESYKEYEDALRTLCN